MLTPLPCLGEPASLQQLFPSLPPELRLKIWTYSLPEPRVVSVRCGSDWPSLSPPPPPPPAAKADRRRKSVPIRRPCIASSSPSFSSSFHPPPPPPSPTPWCTSAAVIPANLHVCHESRAEALRYYALMFGIARQTGHVYFDTDLDVLYFGPRDGYMASEAQLRTLLTLADPEELASVRRVALNEALFWEGTRAASTTAIHVPAGLSASAASAQTQPPPPPQLQQQRQRQHQFSSPALQLATNTAIDVLRLLHTRLPGLCELVLVPRDENPLHSLDSRLVPLLTVDPDSNATGNVALSPYVSAATARLSCQIQEAIRRLNDTTSDWSPPQWNILVLSSGVDRSNSGNSDPRSCLTTVSLPERAALLPRIAHEVLPSIPASLPPLQSQVQQNASRTSPISESSLPHDRSRGSSSFFSAPYGSPALPPSSGMGRPLPPPRNQRHQRLPSLAVVFPHASHGAAGTSIREIQTQPDEVPTSATLQLWELDE